MPGYDAVSFDLDSTLCEPVQDRADLLAATFERADVEQFCSVGELRYAAREASDAGTDREFFEALFTAAAENAGADPSVAPELAAAYLENVEPGRVRFRPGAERALDRARENGPVALITNGAEETQTIKLDALGIRECFDVAVFVDPRNGVPPKPDPAPFEAALSALELDPGDVVHVGDNRYADVGGANEMGMASAWIDHGYDDRTEYEPTHVLDSLEEFDEIL